MTQARQSAANDSDDNHAALEEADESYGRAVGERLRRIRRQKKLSLQDVEEQSAQEFKASVLGAYERGERSISVPRLARLAGIYRVPVDQLLPNTTQGNNAATTERTRTEPKLRLDLAQLESLGGPEGQLISRYVRKIQVQRQDFNGRVLSIRGDDLRLLACILGVSDDHARDRLQEMGLQMRAGANRNGDSADGHSR